MKNTALFAVVMLAALPVQAVDFLGARLCKGSQDIGVELPASSPLALENVEIGDHGGLVMLLSSARGDVMDHVDDLMTGITGRRGEGEGDSLQWSVEPITAVAQRVAKRYAALAVTSSEPCPVDTPAPLAPAAGPAAPAPAPAPSTAPASSTSAAAAAAIVAAIPPAPAASVVAQPTPAPTAAPQPDFEVVGTVRHEAADDTWVDLMGVVANRSGTGYRLATFDAGLYDDNGALICVDTISVSVLKSGQERAFRDAIRCPGYRPDAVAEIRLQFAGGF